MPDVPRWRPSSPDFLLLPSWRSQRVGRMPSGDVPRLQRGGLPVSGYENDGRLSDGLWVLTRYPLPSMTPETPRGSWPWWVATIEQQCGHDEWQLLIWGRELATLEDGSPAPEGTDEDDLLYPLAFRDYSEIRLIADYRAEEIRDRGGRYEGADYL